MIRLDIDREPGRTRVVVAMSGGVDSSVAAALLKESGYEVVGVTLRLYDSAAGPRRPGACCAGEDIQDARRVAEAVGFPHYVLDYKDRFRDEVIDEFADSYVRGETPIPCVACNRTVKFRDLLRTAKDLGADALATGHYVRRVSAPGGVRLLRGADPARDQSYFLFATTREQLDYLHFPLGGLAKEAVRDHAARLGLGVAAKPDSQDICFVPDGDYAALVRRLRPESAESGDIVDLRGTILGRHRGIAEFTVGQRRGLGIGGNAEPLYVVRIEPATRRVVVGPREALGREMVPLHGVNWLGEQPLDGAGFPVSVKLRSTQAPVPGRVISDGPGRALVRLDMPQRAVAPGQACVFYDRDRVLGGGWIARDTAATGAERSAPRP